MGFGPAGATRGLCDRPLDSFAARRDGATFKGVFFLFGRFLAESVPQRVNHLFLPLPPRTGEGGRGDGGAPLPGGWGNPEQRDYSTKSYHPVLIMMLSFPSETTTKTQKCPAYPGVMAVRGSSE